MTSEIFWVVEHEEYGHSDLEEAIQRYAESLYEQHVEPGQKVTVEEYRRNKLDDKGLSYWADRVVTYTVETEDVVDEAEARRLWGNLRQVRVWSEDDSEVSVHQALKDES